MNTTESHSRSKSPFGWRPAVTAMAGHLILQRWAILVLLAVILSLILFSQRIFIRPKLIVGSIAKSDIRADRDFLVVDRSATEQKRLEAVRAVGPVFDFDEDIADTQVEKLSRAFAAAEAMLRQVPSAGSQHSRPSADRPEISRKIRSDVESSLGVPLTDREFDLLLKNRFSPGLLNSLSSLLHATYKFNLMSRMDFLKVESAGGITVRNIKTRQEDDIRNPYAVVVVEDIQPFLQKRAAAVLIQEKPEIRDLAVSLLGKWIQPNLTFNKNASELKKQTILENTKPVYLKIQKNEFIIREGARITPQAMDEIEAFQQIQGGIGHRGSFFLGLLLVILIVTLVLYHISKNFLKNLEGINIDLVFLGLVSIVQLLLVRIGLFFAEAVHLAFPGIAAGAYVYAIPFAVGPLLAAVFLNRNIALVFSIFSSVLITFLFEDRMTMFLFSFVGSAVAIYHTLYWHQRSAFYKAGLFTGLTNMAVILCTGILSPPMLPLDMVLKVSGGLLGGLLSAVIVAGIAPPLESLFGYTTTSKLLELANLNQPLLQRMIVESPGTYQHSIIVASLVEAAAEAIHANSLLAKVSAYYHDIGKLTKPLYFIENQQNWKNKHDKLSPKMSSLVIISHVKDGCDLAKRYKIGRTITDIIRQHHGTSIVGYFYEKAQKDKDPSVRSIPESDFRYPGPKPQTKEAGLVLLGDVVEASSRTLTDPTPARIRNLVQTRIKQVYTDGQLDNCELTLRDLNKIAEVFERTLNAIFHQRIDYPVPGAKDNNRRKETSTVYDFKPPEKAKSRH